jgi:putative methanogenesis marker protein 8
MPYQSIELEEFRSPALMAEHKMEMAKALVSIKDGIITVLSEPKIKHCPLRASIYGSNEENCGTVEETLRLHIDKLGMYGPNRTLESEDMPVSFGASEIISDAMIEGLVDVAVVVCEGAGTVLVNTPKVLQAVGAHMTGLLCTEPIREIQEGLQKKGCHLLADDCTIDQVDGFRKAVELGYRKVAVTITGQHAHEGSSIRDMAKHLGVQPLILAVHTTGISEKEAQILAYSCDIVWACASRAVRTVIGKLAKLQIGVSIPVFALTLEGKRLVLNRVLHFNQKLVIHRAYLPYLPKDKQPKPLI